MGEEAGIRREKEEWGKKEGEQFTPSTSSTSSTPSTPPQLLYPLSPPTNLPPSTPHPQTLLTLLILLNFLYLLQISFNNPRWFREPTKRLRVDSSYPETFRYRLPKQLPLFTYRTNCHPVLSPQSPQHTAVPRSGRANALQSSGVPHTHRATLSQHSITPPFHFFERSGDFFIRSFPSLRLSCNSDGQSALPIPANRSGQGGIQYDVLQSIRFYRNDP